MKRFSITKVERCSLITFLFQVWKAEIEDGLGHSEGKVRMVAVKTVKEGAGEKEHKEFIKELEIMQQIGSHPNIVTLLGCCTDHGNYLFSFSELIYPVTRN